MKLIFDRSILTLIVTLLYLICPTTLYSQDTICIFGIPIVSDVVAKLPTSSSFALKEYESEMDEGVFIRQYFNDTMSVFFREFEEGWKLTSLAISKDAGGVSIDSKKEISIGMLITDLLPTYEEVVESTGRKLIGKFSLDRDIQQIPALSINLPNVIYFDSARLVIHFNKGIVERIMIIIIEEEY